MSPENAPAAGGLSPAATGLHALLKASARRLKQSTWREAAVVLCAGVLLSVALGAAASAIGAGPRGVAVPQLLGLLATLALVLLRYAPLAVSTLAEPSAVARWLDQLLAPRGPGERIGLLSAYELSRSPGMYGESAELAGRAIERAAEEAADAEVLRLLKASAWRSLRTRLAALLACALAVGAFAAFGPRHLGASLRALGALGRMDNPLQPAPPEPRLDDFKLRLRPPAYAERQERSYLSPTGQIRALPGTEVMIETRSRDEVREATLVLSHGEGAEGDSSKTAVEVDGRRLHANFIVSRAGRYRFQLKTTAGEVQEERSGHEIELELDEPPEITLLAPETTPLEVNERDRVSFSFGASDDFGLGDVVLAWQVIGGTREGHRPLTSAGRGQKRFADTVEVDLAELMLKPGDRVAYSLEARDNDTVSGPKVGASVTKELRIYSKSAHHVAVLALQEQAVDELVHILGDHLESAFEPALEAEPYKKMLDVVDLITDRALKADQLLREVVAAAKKDPFGKRAVADAFEAARKELDRDAKRLRGSAHGARRALSTRKSPERESGGQVQRSQEGLVADLEKNVVYLADLLNDQRMIDAEALAKELREQQQALRKALEEYRKAPDDEKRKLLAQAIKEIKARIDQIMEQLAKLKSGIPQDFVNPDALATDDQQQQMDDIQKMIEEGDMEGAMAAMERLLAATEGMLSQLQDGRQELTQREYGEMERQAQKLWKDLEELEKDQRTLAERTEKMSREVTERMKQRLGDPSAFVDKQKKRLEQARDAVERARAGSRYQDEIYDRAKARLEDGMRAMEARDFGAAKESLQNADDDIAQLEQDARRRAEQSRRFGDLFSDGRSAEKSERELHKAQPIVDEVLKDLEKLTPSPESLMSKEEREALSKLKGEQDKLREKATDIGDQLDKLGQQVPVVGPDMKAMLGEAQGAMNQAGQSLGQGDAPSALGQERRAMDALNRMRQELEKGSQSGQGGGPPLPFGQGGQSDPGDQDGNSNQFQSQKVEIPTPEQYKAPTEFRQDILEAAKQGTVQDYREAVRRYYEELVK